ncbi:hypothetical protein [Actinoplanes sp. CA-252034]|uniref:hypothetical protein n=1 Tax=Actinoplanes sp. CA-252034 TaxID=3239906 RepID=UPI003D971C20
MMREPADREPSPYVVARLADHVGYAGIWSDLAERPYLLDHLDPDSVAAAVLRSAYGRRTLPPPIAAALSARHLLNVLEPPDRLMTRWLAAACGWDRGEQPLPAWAHIDHREPAHVALVGHQAPVLAITALRAAEGALVASWARDATIRVWDLVTGRPAGDPIPTGDTRITALAGLGTEDGGLLASTEPGGRITLWRWRTGERIDATTETPATGSGLLAALPQPGGGELLCSAARQGAEVTLWEVAPRLGRVGVIRVPGAVRALTVLRDEDGPTRLVTGGMTPTSDSGTSRRAHRPAPSAIHGDRSPLWWPRVRPRGCWSPPRTVAWTR